MVKYGPGFPTGYTPGKILGDASHSPSPTPGINAYDYSNTLLPHYQYNMLSE